MRDIVILLAHLLVILVRLTRPNGVRSVVGESVFIKHQLLILNRSRQRSPNLRVSDRIVSGLCTLLIRPSRLNRTAIVLKPSTLLSFHRVLKERKYRLLFSSKSGEKSGPKGSIHEVIAAVVQMKLRNPTWGCPRIAQQIALAFDIPINKDIVRRILATHYKPESDASGPSWLAFIGHMKDSLWSGLSALSAENAWTGCFSGRQRTWRRSCSNSNIFIINIERMPVWKGAFPNQLIGLLHGLISLRMDGRSIAEVFIKHQSRLDLPGDHPNWRQQGQQMLLPELIPRLEFCAMVAYHCIRA
jgi:hypothetical protein